MSAKPLTIDAAREANLTLAESDKGHHALHQTIVAYQANRRLGTACTKNRSEVSGSGKKLWKQKGTGRARMGSVRAPHWRGGGVVFGPRPRDYSKKINDKTRRLALRVALTGRLNDGDVLTVPSFSVPDGKTKSFVKALRELTDAKKVLMVTGAVDKPTYCSARNVPKVKLVNALVVNAEHLLDCDKVVLVADALPILSQRTA
jgi:large subunit ribosomal protein L4